MYSWIHPFGDPTAGMKIVKDTKKKKSYGDQENVLLNWDE
jgi:hypothetical protein